MNNIHEYGKIDDYLRFHLVDCGWYLGDKKIEFFEEKIRASDARLSNVSFQKINSYGFTDGERIFLKESLVWMASLVQMQFIALHEYFHIKLGGCIKTLSSSKRVSHEREYACDMLALKHLIKSGKYNIREIRNAISVFKDLIVEDESDTHPSSKSRYNRLMEYVS